MPAGILHREGEVESEAETRGRSAAKGGRAVRLSSAQTVSKRTATRIDEALSRRKLRLSLHMPNSKSPTSFIAED
jgi:hypothetical protein